VFDRCEGGESGRPDDLVRAFNDLRLLFPRSAGQPTPNSFNERGDLLRMEAEAIAGHACVKYSGRVGRSAAARSLDPEAITLAVTAHVRHRYSQYDKVFAEEWDRSEARQAVAGLVSAVLRRWRAV
jgi:hypothetical protein